MTKKRIFYPGRYYVADAENNIVGNFDSMIDAKRYCLETDTILIAVSQTGSHVYTPLVKKADKITLDFNKNSLTVEGEPVTLGGVEYTGECDMSVDNWEKLLADCKNASKILNIVGTPPIDGKDITNEMSDL